MGASRRVIAPILSCLVSLTCLSCVGRNQQPPDSQKNLPQITGSSTTNPPSPSPQTLRGSIGGKYPIQMTLMRGADGALSGSYFYENKHRDLRLEGTIKGKDDVVLREYDDGTHTGVFKGRWREMDYEPEAIFEGDWSMPNGSQQSPFYLFGQHLNFSSPFKLMSREIKEENKQQKYRIEAFYPQLEGVEGPEIDEFNWRALSLVTNEVTKWRSQAGMASGEDLTPEASEDSLKINYITRTATDAVISIEFGFQEYSHGAAHPSHSFQVLTFALKIGRVLKLSDVFKAGAKYLPVIATVSVEQLRRWNKDSAGESGDKNPYLNDPEFVEGAKPKPENYRVWTLTPRGLAITFDYYQLGSYAAGAPAILVPYDKLKDLLDPDSPASSLWH